MIINTFNNAAQYEALHPLFSKAFDFLKENNLEDLADGTVEIAEGLKAIISNKPGKSAEVSLQKFECHDRTVDIQFCVAGPETIGWKPRESCTNQKGEYNPDKDVRFFDEQPETYFTLHGGQFVIFYPEDVHAPMIGDSDIKKIVFKVKI
ncbi:YhcH/YjgK/YiaL family protein [Kaistella palustris]|uniref:YhcH/YjgK/YiaL family protein n=1 Tax=Kaistella palustris TaxID=493376 RepID=UPI0003FF9A42|nr:YhcH/YjgK/YiaL family protein [Kaistella palustris]